MIDLSSLTPAGGSALGALGHPPDRLDRRQLLVELGADGVERGASMSSSAAISLTMAVSSAEIEPFAAPIAKQARIMLSFCSSLASALNSRVTLKSSGPPTVLA